MSTGESERSAAPQLTSLPSLDTIPVAPEGYDREHVREAFEAFRRHTAQLQAQLRVLQAARRAPSSEPTGHAVRMDALHLIRAAAEFADTLERDAQTASAAQIQRTEEEVRRRQRELQEREAELERHRQESERQRLEIVNAAKAEARELTQRAHADATRELREAEARGSRLLEQSRHQATELTNAARAEVEATLEWARAQATSVMHRAQQGAEQLLAAAGLGEPAISQVVAAIMGANEREAPPQPGGGEGARADASPPQPPVSAPEPPPAPAAPPVTEHAPAPDAEGGEAPEPPAAAPDVPPPPAGGEGDPNDRDAT